EREPEFRANRGRVASEKKSTAVPCPVAPQSSTNPVAPAAFEMLHREATSTFRFHSAALSRFPARLLFLLQIAPAIAPGLAAQAPIPTARLPFLHRFHARASSFAVRPRSPDFFCWPGRLSRQSV